MLRKFFGSARALPSRKKLFATRYSLLAAVLLVANCQSPFAAVFGSAGASPSQFRPPSRVPRPVLFFVPCPMSPAPLKSVRVDELRKMRYGFMGKTQIDG
jgi:hypothetical protein